MLLLVRFFTGQDETESTAFLGALWALSAQSMPRKAVDLGYMILHTLSYKILTNRA